MWQEELAELTSVSPTPDFLLSANEADGYSKAAAAAEFQEKRGLCTSMSSGQTVSQFCFLYCTAERSLEVGEGSQRGRENLGNPENHVLWGPSCLLQGLLGGSEAGTRQSNL